MEESKVDYNGFVKLLEAKRKSLGVSLRQIADKYHMSPSTLCKFEKGCCEESGFYKNLAIVERYCEILDVKFDYLVAV